VVVAALGKPETFGSLNSKAGKLPSVGVLGLEVVTEERWDLFLLVELADDGLDKLLLKSWEGWVIGALERSW